MEAFTPENSDLGDQLEAFVVNLVADGRYASRISVLRAGVNLIVERERTLRAFDAAIHQGLADIQAGRVRAADDVLDRLEAKYAAVISAPHE